MPNPALFTLAARRQFLADCGFGLGSIALGTLLGSTSGAAELTRGHNRKPAGARAPHHPPRAKSVIQLFMCGGPSQLDLFDPKPALQKYHGQQVPKSYVEGKRFAFLKPDASLLASQRRFARHGQSGADVSELLPHTSAIVDKLAIIRSMKTDVFNHGPAKVMLNTGVPTFGRPSMGSWVLYGIGSESHDLPGYVVLQSGPRGPRGGSALYHNGFLSSVYQGVPLRNTGDPILNISPPSGVSPARQQRVLDTILQLNAERLDATGDSEIATRVANYEMAARMQASAPALVDLSDETEETLGLYGAEPGKTTFANNCLLARRLVERGVRFVTLFHTDWDHHGNAGLNLDEGIEKTCRETDQPAAALVMDLERRGLLDETLVVWGGEFGRTPMGEVRTDYSGRDHHIDAFTMWLAGGGIRPGTVLGTTDEIGYEVVDAPVHVHDLQATVLHLLGLDHLRLTYRFQGRDFRLTDVGGQVVSRLLA